MQQPARCLHVHPAQGATGQEAPGLERMHKAPGSGPAFATAAPRGAGPEKPGSEEGVVGGHVGASVALACSCVCVRERANWVGGARRMRAHGCRPVAILKTAGASNQRPKCFPCRGTGHSPTHRSPGQKY